MSIHDDDLSNLGSSHRPVISPAFTWRNAGSSTESFYATTAKPLLDVFLVLLASPIILSLIILSAAAIALDGHNPFYTQKRVGKDGKVFDIFKLRTMRPNADQMLEAYLDSDPEARREWESSQKLRRDPRITLVGRVLRKCSLDELPQFLNVLMGDMSIVGPRPFMLNQRPLYSGKRYFEMRPGLTGLWQISSRNEAEFVSRVQFDDLYARTLSMKGDLRIMLRTVKTVFRGTGY